VVNTADQVQETHGWDLMANLRVPTLLCVACWFNIGQAARLAAVVLFSNHHLSHHSVLIYHNGKLSQALLQKELLRQAVATLSYAKRWKRLSILLRHEYFGTFVTQRRFSVCSDTQRCTYGSTCYTASLAKSGVKCGDDYLATLLCPPKL